MKLVRYGAPGREKPGILDADGKIRDLSRVVTDIDGAMLSSGGLAKIKKANLKRLKAVPGKPRLGPCVGHVRNFIAIGLNYADHAAESGVPVPAEPVVFNKAPSCICGPNDDTMIPKGSTKLDYECELAVIIGKRARYLAKDKAMDAVAGYCISNDVSERAFQMEHGQTICKGKGAETFGPLGPWFVSKDEIRQPQKLAMWTNVNGAEAPARLDRHHGVRCGAPGLVPVADFRAGAGRRDRHRHAAGRGLRHEACAGVSQSRRRGGDGDRGAWAAQRQKIASAGPKSLNASGAARAKSRRATHSAPAARPTGCGCAGPATRRAARQFGHRPDQRVEPVGRARRTTGRRGRSRHISSSSAAKRRIDVLDLALRVHGGDRLGAQPFAARGVHACAPARWRRPAAAPRAPCRRPG